MPRTAAFPSRNQKLFYAAAMGICAAAAFWIGAGAPVSAKGLEAASVMRILDVRAFSGDRVDVSILVERADGKREVCKSTMVPVIVDGHAVLQNARGTVPCSPLGKS